MNSLSFFIEELAKPLKRMLFLFVITISLGYGFGLRYLYLTTEANTTTLQENYLGNEDNEDAEVMKFKKTEKSILTFLHDHLLSMGLLQLVLSILLYFTKLPARFKNFLAIEPFVSMLITFSGIYLLWLGIEELKYLVMISGTLFHFTFMTSLVLLSVKLLRK
jgi:hypothetical protein